MPVVFEVEGLVLTRPEARGLLERLALLYRHARARVQADAPEAQEGQDG